MNLDYKERTPNRQGRPEVSVQRQIHDCPANGRSAGFAVVTNNISEFEHIPDLRVENWGLGPLVAD
jgi:hypothetical protein